jgi:hypothetical protein
MIRVVDVASKSVMAFASYLDPAPLEQPLPSAGVTLSRPRARQDRGNGAPTSVSNFESVDIERPGSLTDHPPIS